MSQLVETGQGLAEFPDEMSHDEIAGVIKKQFYSIENPPPAEIKPVHSAKAENVIAGMDQAPTYPSKADADPTIENIAGAGMDIAEGLVGSIESLPKMALQGAKIATGTSYQQRQGLTELLSEILPMSQQMGSDLEAPLGTRESFRGIGQAALMAAPGLEFLRGVRGIPKAGSLEAKLAPISGEAPPVQEVPLAPELTAKPEILTPQEEVTPQGQAEPVGVTETLAELKRRNGVTPGEVKFGSETPTPQTNVAREETSVAPGTVRLYHGASEGAEVAGSDFTPIRSYAQGYADKAVGGGKLWYVDVPEGSLKTHDEYGQPMSRVVVPDEIATKARPVPEVSQAPVESGLQAKPKLPENVEVTIKASTSKGEELEVKMDAREAEKVLNERKSALENLIDCLGA